MTASFLLPNTHHCFFLRLEGNHRSEGNHHGFSQVYVCSRSSSAAAAATTNTADNNPFSKVQGSVMSSVSSITDHYLGVDMTPDVSKDELCRT